MVALAQRIIKLEKRVADRVEYQSGEEDLAEALAILTQCGAGKEPSN